MILFFRNHETGFQNDWNILQRGIRMSGFIYNNLLPESKPLPAYFFTACAYHKQENVYRPKGARSFHQIMFVVEGTGILRCQGQTYSLKKGNAFFSAMQVGIEYENTGGLVTAFLTAKGSAVRELMHYFNCDGFLFYESVNLDKFLADIDRIIKTYQTDRHDGLLSAMTYTVYEEFFELQNSRFDELDAVVQYIERSFVETLTLEKLAQIGHMSVSKLCHDFKERFHCSLFRYILDLRLNYARTLLLSLPATTTKEAAARSGFDDASYFCRAYKKKFGKSPGEDKLTL